MWFGDKMLLQSFMWCKDKKYIAIIMLLHEKT